MGSLLFSVDCVTVCVGGLGAVPGTWTDADWVFVRALGVGLAGPTGAGGAVGVEGSWVGSAGVGF